MTHGGDAVAGNTVAWPSGPFASFRTLTGNIAIEMGYAEGLHRSALFVSARWKLYTPRFLSPEGRRLSPRAAPGPEGVGGVG